MSSFIPESPLGSARGGLLAHNRLVGWDRHASDKIDEEGREGAECVKGSALSKPINDPACHWPCRDVRRPRRCKTASDLRRARSSLVM